MDLLLIMLALVLPVLLGVAWVNVLIPAGVSARVPVVLGHGILLGLIGVPLILRTIDALGLGLSFPVAAAVCAFLTLAGAFFTVRSRRVGRSMPLQASVRQSLSPMHKALFLVFVLLAASHVLLPGIELLGRPLYAWDATMHWATKSRTWFEYGYMVPFVEKEVWLNMGGAGVYNDFHPGYPPAVPLLQVWMSAAIGRWDESLMNLPWLLCFVGLGLSFYGQVREAGVDALLASVFTYLLLSMPLLNVHVALAGYADLYLGAFLCASLMAFHNWTVGRQPWQACLAVGFSLAATITKNEGAYWLLPYIPALVIVLMPVRKAALILVSLLVLIVAMLLVLPDDLVIAGHSKLNLELGFRPEAFENLLESYWMHSSWHLAVYLLAVVLPVSFIVLRRELIAYRGIIAVVLFSLVLFLFLFTSTRFALGSIRFTSVARVGIHLLPGMLFLLALLTQELISRRRPET